MSRLLSKTPPPTEERRKSFPLPYVRIFADDFSYFPSLARTSAHHFEAFLSFASSSPRESHFYVLILILARNNISRERKTRVIAPLSGNVNSRAVYMADELEQSRREKSFCPACEVVWSFFFSFRSHKSSIEPFKLSRIGCRCCCCCCSFITRPQTNQQSIRIDWNEEFN